MKPITKFPPPAILKLLGLWTLPTPAMNKLTLKICSDIWKKIKP